MVELNNFIHVYENTLESNVCQYLIEFFEKSPELQEKIENNERPNFTQINLTQNYKISEEISEIHNYFIHKTFEYKNKYIEFIYKDVFPETHAFEQFRIKRYLPNKNELFDTHVDVSNYETSRRFLSFLWYLNDVKVGGETQFNDLFITPKMGKLIIFPPLWLFPHKGLKPISNSKYIISTYLHYI